MTEAKLKIEFLANPFCLCDRDYDVLSRICNKHGYITIEVCVDLRPPDQSGINTSFFPFRKSGFIVDDMSEGWEFRPETRMCHLNLKNLERN